MVTRTCCPECGSRNYKRNGHTHNGKPHRSISFGIFSKHIEI
jgi:hypothetical protein